MLHLKCLTVFWIRICLDNCSVICTMTLCYALYQTHSEFWHIQHSVFSGICRHIQLYSALLRHIDAFHAYWHIIKAYSGLFRHIQHPVWPSYIHNLTICWALAYIELEAKPCETLTRHIQNPAIFRHIQNLVQLLHTQKPGILEILEYSALFHNCI